MDKLLAFLCDLLILGLFIHWIFGFIKSPLYPNLENIRKFLNSIYGPVLDLIKNKLKPIIKVGDRNYLDLSPLILIIIIGITRRALAFIL